MLSTAPDDRTTAEDNAGLGKGLDPEVAVGQHISLVENEQLAGVSKDQTVLTEQTTDDEILA